MNTYEWLGLAIAAVAGAFTALAKIYRFGPFLDTLEPMPSTDDSITEVPLSYEPVKSDIPSPILPNVLPVKLLWDTPRNAYHSTRVLCDEAGLTYDQKNEICYTIYGESEFNNNAVCKNKNAKGEVTSVDVGICQINSYWHCGKDKTFPSTDYVVAHPEKAVEFMIKMYKIGKIDLWIAHKSGRYLTFSKPNSPMWKLGLV